MTKKQTAAKAAAPAAALSNPILAALPAPASQVVNPEDLSFNPRNPARGRDEKSSLRELVLSIQQHGILQPLTAREVRRKDGPLFLELICGERRLRAAIELGLEEVPVRVYGQGQVSDARALEIALVENMHRRDPSPVDEAAAYELLRGQYGFALEDVAAQVGRSVAHVQRRLSLNNLQGPLPDLLRAGWISVGAAEQFSRLSGAKAQVDAVREAANYGTLRVAAGSDLAPVLSGKRKPEEGGVREPMSIAAAREAVDNQTRRLDAAPWDLDSAELVPKAGACSSCPKRASAQAGLFGTEFEDAALEDACMDSACWSEKAAAFSLVALAKAKEIGAVVLGKKESARLYPTGSYLADHELVDVDRPCELPGRRGSWRSVAKEILPDLELKVATDREGLPHTLVAKRELILAAKKSGLIKPEKVPERDSDSARRANQLAVQKAQRTLADAVIDRALESQQARELEGSFQHWEFLARGLMGRALHDSKREVARRYSRGLDQPLKVQDVPSLLIVLLAGGEKLAPGDKLAGLGRLCFELIAATGIGGGRYGFECEGLGEAESEHNLGPAVEQLADLFGVDVERVKKQLDQEKEKAAAGKKPAAGKVKVKRSRPAKPAPRAASKASKSARGKAAKGKENGKA